MPINATRGHHLLISSWVFLLLLCHTACTEVFTGKAGDTAAAVEAGETLAPDEYAAFVSADKSPLTVSNTINGFTFSATYLPHYYQAMREFPGADAADSNVQAFVKQHAGIAWFKLKISQQGQVVNQDLVKSLSGVRGNYAGILEYFAFNMQSDLSLIAGSDTIPCALWHYERGFDAKPDAVFMMSFEMPQNPEKLGKDLVLHYNDRLFQTGMINLRIPQQTLLTLPTPKI